MDAVLINDHYDNGGNDKRNLGNDNSDEYDDNDGKEKLRCPWPAIC